MTTVLISLLFILNAKAEQPSHPCVGLNCSPEMLQIADEFHRSSGVPEQNFGKIYSGQCHLLYPGYDPKAVRFGFVMLDKKDSSVFMNARFSFSSRSNPYASLNPEKARAKYQDAYRDSRKVLITENYSFVNTAPNRPEKAWKFWFRSNQDGLLVVSEWGPGKRSFCRFVESKMAVKSAKTLPPNKVTDKKPATQKSAKSNRQKPPRAQSSCDQSGIASYYWQPQMTASGERFNPNDLTAAHRTLRMGTRVKVVNPRNGRSVVVRINDRGPFIAGRIIDLSKAAAHQIGIAGQGLGKVHLSCNW